MAIDNALPNGWTKKNIQELIGRSGIFVDGDWVESKDQDPDGDIRLIQLADIGDGFYRNRSNRFLTSKKAIELGCTFLEKGDLLVARMPDPLGRACIFPGDTKRSVTVVDVCIIRTDKANLSWMMHAINSPQFRASVESLQSGSTRKRISRKNLAKIEVPIPPPDQQERIVTKIEELFTQLEAGTAALRRVQAGLKRYKASVLKSAVEGRLVEQDPSEEPADKVMKRFKKTPLIGENLPSLPEGWSWAKVEDLVKVSTGATPLRSENKYWENGTVPWITSGAINSLHIYHADEFISIIALKETNAKIIPSGSLLVAMYGEGKTRGKVSELKIEAATNQACAALIFDDITVAYKPFLKIFFMKNYEDIRRLSSGGVQPNLNLSIIRNTHVPLPPIAEQQRIVAEVERRLSMVEYVQEVVEAGLKRANRLRQAILKRAFEGRLP